MNVSNFEHAAFALLMQIAIGLVTGNWWAGAAAGAFFFLGREHAQFEKKLTSGWPVGNLNPFAGFQFWKWNLDSQLDLVFPVVATLAVAIAYEIGVQVTFYPGVTRQKKKAGKHESKTTQPRNQRSTAFLSPTPHAAQRAVP